MPKMDAFRVERVFLGLVCLLLIALPAMGKEKETNPSPRLHRGPASRPLRSVAPLRPPKEHREHPLRKLPKPHPKKDEDDTVVQTGASKTSLDSLYSFPGIGDGDYGYDVFLSPADPNGAVGTSQYMQWVNTSFAIFAKSGALLYGPAAGNTLWADLINDPNFTACATTNDGDPIVKYDQLAKRWFVTQMSFTSDFGSYLCLAVSESDQIGSGGALGQWNRYAISYGSLLPDFPKLAIWPSAYFLTVNLYTPTGGSFSFVGYQLCALDRSVLLTNGAPTATTFQCLGPFSNAHSLLAADLDGSRLPGDPSTNFVVSLDFNFTGLNFWKFKVDFNDPRNTTLTGPTAIAVAPITPACCITQPNTTQELDSLTERMMYRLAYRNLGSHESLVLNHTVNVTAGKGKSGGTRAAVRWYEIRNPSGTPTVYQQGTFSPDTNHRWMGSIAMDKFGDIAVGYSVSGPSLYPSIRIAGRVPGDPLGKLQGEVTVTAGGGSQFFARWGDYTSMNVDPVDDCTFWYTNQYLKSSGSFNWSTTIARVKFPACP